MAPASPPVVLTIAGFDPSSGAGATADLKTIAAHGCYGLACITAMTVQNTQGVIRVEPIPGGLIRETLDALADDFPIAAIRIGMLGSAMATEAVVDFLSAHSSVPVVLDPVLRSSSGAELLEPAGIGVLKSRLLKMALVITPNISEAEILTGEAIQDYSGVQRAALKLQKSGARNVVITGGHLKENIDFLLEENGSRHEFRGERIESGSTHGTGCAFASAIACSLAQGIPLPVAVSAAKEFVAGAIRTAFPLGKGQGPINHFFPRK